MELNKLYEIAKKEKIYIMNFKLENKAIIGYDDNNNCAIGLDYSKISNYTEEKCLLAEELRTLLLF